MSKIKVALRVRPLSSREANDAIPVVVTVDDNSAFITDIRVPERPSADSRQRSRQFDFDHGFWLQEEGYFGASQEEVYEEMGPSLEQSILEGYNACLLAYGQSGTGKTHTMLGTKEDPGLIPRLCQGLWDKFTAQCGKSTFRMEVSFMEIYREKVRDLLTPPDKTLKLREHPQLGPHVQDLTRVEVSEQLSLLDLLWEGECRRATGSTGSNRRSSRSHAIWTLYLTSTRAGADGTGLITTNQVHLVDLAGSEKADLITSKNLLAEGKDINRSLVSLGNVISSLAERAPHIPYRDSALTWLLKDSLGGNATTAIIITASPASSCHAQTLNSLRFAQRARLVENQPKINCVKAGSGKQSGIFSGMSSFDLRKDISRLASIIRTAQTNGGILRGLLPRNGWNRLISAIENWNDYDTEQESREGMKRGSSVDTTTTSTSVTDLTISADSGQDEARSRPQTSPNSPQVPHDRIPGTEVFIPVSNSIKCLTWRQDEVHQLPKAQSIDSEDEVFSSPPTSPYHEAKVNYVKYLIPIKFPTSHNMDSESWISEKIHGNYLCKNMTPIKLEPVEVPNHFECSPVIREKLPTLVNPQSIPSSVSEVELFTPEVKPKVLVQCKGMENTSDFSFSIPQVSEFRMQQPLLLASMQSTDEEEDEPLRTIFKRYSSESKPLRSFRTIFPETVKPEEPDSSTEEALFFSESIASSSSYESLQISDHSRLRTKVKVVENCHLDFDDIADKISELETEFPSTHQVREVDTAEQAEMNETWATATLESTPDLKSTKPIDGYSSSKFRNHFVREFHQMDSIGKQIQNLKRITARYQVVQPFLQKIAELDYQDHFTPDPDLDAEIEECSGWDMSIEYEKVQQEMDAINKILKKGAIVKSKSESSSLSARESLGSIDSYSMQSRRSSNASSSHNMEASCHKSQTSISNSPPSVASLSITRREPCSRSTPIGQEAPQWSDPSFQQPGYPLEPSPRTNQFSMLHSKAGHAIQQSTKWRPMLPKTHRYLHSGGSSSGYPSSNSKIHRNVTRDVPSCPTVYQHEASKPDHSQYYVMQRSRPPVLRSMSSENSSCHEGNSFPYHSNQTGLNFCSCLENESLTQHRWSESTESELLDDSYEFYPAHERRYSGISLVKSKTMQTGRKMFHS